MNGAPLLELRDIHAPAAPSFWPPAPGWWLVAVLAVLLLIALAWALSRLYRRWRRRRIALQALLQVRRSVGDDRRALAAELSILLRRVALTRYPRSEVAGLSGVHWLQFLDETGGGGRFVSGPGRALAEAPYAPAFELDTEELCALVRAWLKHNA